MISSAQIKDSFYFSKSWQIVFYLLICVGYIGLFQLSGTESMPFIAILTIGIFALLFLALVFYDVQFGFYGMIIFGFIMSSLDRFFNSAIPFYYLLFALPVLLFITVLIKSSLHRGAPSTRWHPLVLGYLVLLAYEVVQVFNPEMDSFWGWLSYLRQEASLLLLLLVCFYIFKDLKSIRFFFKFLFGAIIVTAIYGLVQEYFGLSSWDRRWVYGNPDVLGLYSLYGLGIRKFSFLTDPANFGTLMATGGIGLLILTLESGSKKQKVWLLIFAIIVLWSMSYSGTRTANLMVIAGLALYILMTIYRKRTWIFTFFGGLVFLFILYAPIYGNLTLFRVRTAFRAPSKDKSLEVRTINRELMRPYIESHPFGGGINTTSGVGSRYNPDHYLAGFPPDSQLFATTLEQGWVGLALNLLFLFLILFYGIHYFYRCRNKEIKTYYAVMVAMIFSLGVVGGYAQYTLKSVPQFFIYISFIAIIIRLRDLDKSAAKNIDQRL